MAAVASYCEVVFEVVLIDRTHHLNHLACDLLGLLIVLVEVLLHVAKPTLDTKRGGYESHGWDHLAGWDALQDLNILVDLFRGLTPAGVVVRVSTALCVADLDGYEDHTSAQYIQKAVTRSHGCSSIRIESSLAAMQAVNLRILTKSN